MKKIIIAAATVAGLAMSGSAMATGHNTGEYHFTVGFQTGTGTPVAIQAGTELAGIAVDAGVYFGSDATKNHDMAFSAGTSFGDWTVNYRHDKDGDSSEKTTTDAILVGMQSTFGAHDDMLVQAQTNLWSRVDANGAKQDALSFTKAIVTVSKVF